ncbi:Inosine/uridine-preferring nucleoside hydrolase domain-containing protein [Trichoderma austrokoningii]
MAVYSLPLAILLSAIFGLTGAATPSPKRGQPIIIDTDLFSDVDDVGALTIANVLHNCGLADLRGVVINSPSYYGALGVSSLCTYFNNEDIPIAAFRPLTNDAFFDKDNYLYGEYVSKLAYNWPRKVKDSALTPTPVDLYRTILSSADDDSIHIISIGGLTNLANLLKSEGDHISHLSGPQLISAKVSELVVMGGQYPSGWEYNFGGIDPKSTADVVDYWPKNVKVTYSGGELGGNVFSGQNFAQQLSPDSPVLSAYQWYVGRGSTVRASWDPITTLYGILGLEWASKLRVRPMLAYANEFGYNSINAANGSNAWVNDATVTNHHWLRLAEGVTNSSMARLLDEIMTHDSSAGCCFHHGIFEDL